MSYPDPQYKGDSGEVNAIYRPASAPGDLRVGTSEASYLIKGEATGGKFGLYRWDMAPGTPGAQPHFHRTLSESFFILSGNVGLYNGKEWTDAGPGDYLAAVALGKRRFTPEEYKAFCEAHDNIFVSPQ